MKLIYFTVLISFSIFSQDATTVYNNTVKSCGIVKHRSERGSASGFFIGSNIFVTNKHVTDIVSRKNMVIYNKNGQQFTAEKIMIQDDNSDISIIQTAESSSDYLKLANPDSINQGDKVYAIGNPVSYSDFKTYDFNITEGIINNITYESLQFEHSSVSAKVILHSANLNPGNSGGPLLNHKGEVIGINAFVKYALANNLFFAIHLSELIEVLNIKNIPYNEKVKDTLHITQESLKDSIAFIKSAQKTGSNYEWLLFVLFLVLFLAIMLPMTVSRKRDYTNYIKTKNYNETLIQNEKLVSNLQIQDNKIYMPDGYITFCNNKYFIGEGLTIGRNEDCNIIILDKSVSRFHARIIHDGGDYLLNDLNSKNGTDVNGFKISRTILRNDDIISIGNNKLIFKLNYN